MNTLTDNAVKNETAAEYASGAAYDESVIEKARLMLESILRKHGHAMTSPEKTETYLRLHMQSLEHEEFWVLFLDNQHRLIEAESMFRGTIDGASVYPREVAKRCLQLNAAAVVYAHNHPSGINEPSQADKTITAKLKDALALFDIRSLDHFIIGDGYFSFAEHGLM